MLLSGAAASAARIGGSGGNSGGSGGRRTFSPRLGSGADCEVGLTSSEVFSTRSRRTGGKGARQLDRSARPTSPSAAAGSSAQRDDYCNLSHLAGAAPVGQIVGFTIANTKGITAISLAQLLFH